MDALRDHEGREYQGVAGRAEFDYTLNNIAPSHDGPGGRWKIYLFRAQAAQHHAANGETGMH